MKYIFNKISSQELFLSVSFMTIFYIIGGVLHDVITAIVVARGADDITVFPLATLLGIVGYFAVTLLVGSMSMTQDFDMIVGLGGTRKEYFIKKLVEMIGSNILCSVAILVLAYIERFKLIHFWSRYEIEFDILPYLNLKIIGIAILLTTGLVFMVASIILKFGKTGFWILWVIYMAVCLSMARIHDVVLTLHMDKLVSSFSANREIVGLFSIVISFLLIGVSWLIVRRQAVRA